MSGLFTKSFQRLGAAVASREQMQTVISGNIANADTPHYKTDQRSFSDFLEARTAGASSTPMRTTHAKHFAAEPATGLTMSVFRQSDSEARMDGNTVNLEKQMSTLAENQLMHELNMKLIQGRLQGIANVIKEGGR